MADYLIKKIKIGTQEYNVYDIRVPDNAQFTDTTYTGTQGITLSGTVFKHTNAITAQGTKGLYKVSFDAQGHITGATAVQKSDITALGIPAQDTKYTHPTYGSQGTSGLYKIKTTGGHVTETVSVQKSDITALGIPAQDTTYQAERGIQLSSGKFGHQGSVTAQGTQGLYKVSYDAYGHITGATAVQKSDITTLGIPAQDTTYSGQQGITVSGGKVGHTHGITAQTTAVFKKFKYDAQGHITGTADVDSTDIAPLVSNLGTDASNALSLAQSLKAELENPGAQGTLSTVLDDLSVVLGSGNKASAVTGINAISYTAPVLSVDANGVLSMSSGSVSGGTASGTQEFVKAKTNWQGNHSNS